MLEICLQNIDDVYLADKFKDIIGRIELNSGLEVGGLSPGIELLKKIKEITDIPVIAMLRCRAGNFLYTENEHKLHKEIGENLLKYADGIAFGALTEKNTINIEQTKNLIELTKKFKKEFIFHRAIDFTADYQESIKILDDLGVDRILTSGHEENAEKGIENIKKLKTRCEILAGSGINEKNFKKFLPLQIHGTFSKKIISSFGTYIKLDEEKLQILRTSNLF